MIVLGGLLALAAVSLWQAHRVWDDELWLMLSFFSAGARVFGVAALPLSHMEVHNGIAQFRAVESTSVVARENRETWEMAAWQQEVADANRWLASIQYWNSTVFDIWVPDEIEDIEPIR